jgi:hypothetical protein
MSKPLRSRPIEFYLEENGDLYTYGNHEALADTVRSQTGRQVPQRS